MERCNYCPLRSHLMNKNKRIVFGIVGGSLLLGFIVDDTDILVQLITTVLMLCGLIMIILSFLARK